MGSKQGEQLVWALKIVDSEKPRATGHPTWEFPALHIPPAEKVLGEGEVQLVPPTRGRSLSYLGAGGIWSCSSLPTRETTGQNEPHQVTEAAWPPLCGVTPGKPPPSLAYSSLLNGGKGDTPRFFQSAGLVTRTASFPAS